MKLRKALIIFTLAIFSFSILYSQDSLESIVTWELDDDAQFRCSNPNRGGSDLNNDGYDDYIHWDPSDYDNYKFQFFMGKEIPDTTYDFAIEAPFGSGYISWGGDLNADGYNDIVYGVKAYWGDAGSLYICLGSDSIDLEPELILHGEDYATDSYNLGFEKGFNGGYDFNGDGYDDILAGGTGPSYYWNGQVDLFFGGEEIDTIPDFHIQGAEVDEFGKHKTVGDINGDGYDDLIVSRNTTAAVNSPIKFEIYLGGNNMDTAMDAELERTFRYDSRISCQGDFNGDGFDDIIMGTGDPQNFNHSYILIYYGDNNINLNQACDSIDVNHVIRKVFYYNLNNDIYDDLVAFIRVNDNENYVYIYLGEENFNTNCSPDIIINLSSTCPCNICTYCCNLGDFNGDNEDEILINPGDPFNSATMYGLHGGNDIDNYELEITDYEIINTFPNPFTDNTNIHFSIKNSNNIQLDIYNIKGQKVRSILNDKMEGGNHVIEWDGTDDKGHFLGSGIYFIKLTLNSRIKATQKIILMK